MKKICKRCLEEKDILDFYTHNARCKQCIKDIQSSKEYRDKVNAKKRERYKNDIDYRNKILSQQSAFSKTSKGKKIIKKANEKYSQSQKGKEANKRKSKKYRATVNFKESIERYRNNYPERRSASIKLMNALKMGLIIKPDECSICHNKGDIEGHHYDYSKPLDVIWCCKDCHTNFHYSSGGLLRV